MSELYFKAERPHLCSPVVNVNILVEAEGSLQYKQFQTVLNKIFQIHPTLCATIKKNHDGKAYLVLHTAPIPEPIWIEADSHTDIEQLILQNDRIPFDFEHGPLVRFIVLHEQTKFTLLLCGHHILGDGMAYSYLMQDILCLLEQPELTPSVKIPPVLQDTNVFPKKSRLGILPKFFFHRLNRSWRKEQRTFSTEDYLSMFQGYHKTHHTAIYRTSLSGEDYTHMLQVCHQNAITVTTAWTAALEKAVSELLETHHSIPQRIGIAVNIRNELSSHPGSCMGNFVSGIALSHQYDTSLSFKENAAVIQTMIRNAIDKPQIKYMADQLLFAMDDNLLDAFQFAAYSSYSSNPADQLAKMLGEGQPVGGIGITNLGKDPVHFMNKNYTVTDFQFICPASPSNDLTIGMGTYLDTFHLCIRYNDNLITPDTIQKIYMQAKSDLLAI